MKKKYIAGSAAALVLSVCAYELGLHQAQTTKENNRVSYIDGKQVSQKAERERFSLESYFHWQYFFPIF